MPFREKCAKMGRLFYNYDGEPVYTAQFNCKG